MQAKFRSICMESSQHNWANISETICPELLIFGEKASWTLFFQNILTNPIISQISFWWRHHFVPCRFLKQRASLTRLWKLSTPETLLNQLFFLLILSYQTLKLCSYSPNFWTSNLIKSSRPLSEISRTRKLQRNRSFRSWKPNRKLSIPFTFKGNKVQYELNISLHD